jgi:hypothetical protein
LLRLDPTSPSKVIEDEPLKLTCVPFTGNIFTVESIAAGVIATGLINGIKRDFQTKTNGFSRLSAHLDRVCGLPFKGTQPEMATSLNPDTDIARYKETINQLVTSVTDAVLPLISNRESSQFKVIKMTTGNGVANLEDFSSPEEVLEAIKSRVTRNLGVNAGNYFKNRNSTANHDFELLLVPKEFDVNNKLSSISERLYFSDGGTIPVTEKGIEVLKNYFPDIVPIAIDGQIEDCHICRSNSNTKELQIIYGNETRIVSSNLVSTTNNVQPLPFISSDGEIEFYRPHCRGRLLISERDGSVIVTSSSEKLDIDGFIAKRIRPNDDIRVHYICTGAIKFGTDGTGNMISGGFTGNPYTTKINPEINFIFQVISNFLKCSGGAKFNLRTTDSVTGKIVTMTGNNLKMPDDHGRVATVLQAFFTETNNRNISPITRTTQSIIDQQFSSHEGSPFDPYSGKPNVSNYDIVGGNTFPRGSTADAVLARSLKLRELAIDFKDEIQQYQKDFIPVVLTTKQVTFEDAVLLAQILSPKDYGCAYGVTTKKTDTNGIILPKFFSLIVADSETEATHIRNLTLPRKNIIVAEAITADTPDIIPDYQRYINKVKGEYSNYFHGFNQSKIGENLLRFLVETCGRSDEITLAYKESLKSQTRIIPNLDYKQSVKILLISALLSEDKDRNRYLSMIRRGVGKEDIKVKRFFGLSSQDQQINATPDSCKMYARQCLNGLKQVARNSPDLIAEINRLSI